MLDDDFFFFFCFDDMTDAEAVLAVSSRMFLKMLTRLSLGMLESKVRSACSTAEAGQVDGSGNCSPIALTMMGSVCNAGDPMGNEEGVEIPQSAPVVAATALDTAANSPVIVSMSSTSS